VPKEFSRVATLLSLLLFSAAPPTALSSFISKESILGWATKVTCDG